MANSKHDRDVYLPPGGENEEFIFAYNQHVASSVGKIRNMTRRWNNVQAGRANVKSAKQLTTDDICVIHNARRILGQKVTLLKPEKLNGKSMITRRSEAFRFRTSWLNGETLLSLRSAQFLLESTNLPSTQHVGLEKIAQEVVRDFHTQKRNAEALFNKAAEDGAAEDADDPMLPSLAEERFSSPVPSTSEDRPQPCFGIHHSMLDFHMPFSKV
jgi:hypothetical protein